MSIGSPGPPPVGGICGLVINEELAVAAIFATAGMVEALFYGIHFILFCLCVFLLLRKRRSTQLAILLPAVVMFALSTADIALTFRILSYTLPRINDSHILKMATRLIQGKDTIFVASNCVAELTLLYRCYMVWDRSKYVLVGCVFVIADTIWGFLGMGPNLLASNPNKFVSIYVWSLFSINILLTLITVSRLVWILKFAKRVLGHKHLDIYHTAIAILVETSLVYSACLLIYLLYSHASSTRIYLIIICMRVVGIMPTLLIAQVALGGIKHKTNSPTTISKFQVRSNTVAQDTIRSSMARGEEGRRNGFRSNPLDEEADIAMQESAIDTRPKSVFEPLTVDVPTENHSS